jgi:hypothetical protein
VETDELKSAQYWQYLEQGGKDTGVHSTPLFFCACLHSSIKVFSLTLKRRKRKTFP